MFSCANAHLRVRLFAARFSGCPAAGRFGGSQRSLSFILSNFLLLMSTPSMSVFDISLTISLSASPSSQNNQPNLHTTFVPPQPVTPSRRACTYILWLAAEHHHVQSPTTRRPLSLHLISNDLASVCIAIAKLQERGGIHSFARAHLFQLLRCFFLRPSLGKPGDSAAVRRLRHETSFNHRWE